MKESTNKFLAANRKGLQTNMKAWEYCADGVRPMRAIKDIMSDLKGKLVQFPIDKQMGRYNTLLGIEMVEFTNGQRKYWRACPLWQAWYLSANDKIALQELAAGTYQDGLRAGGASYDKNIREFAETYAKELNNVIEV